MEELSRWRKFLCKIGLHEKIDAHDMHDDLDMSLAVIDILIRGVPWKCTSCNQRGRYNY